MAKTKDITPKYDLIAMRDKVQLIEDIISFGNVVGGVQQNATGSVIGNGDESIRWDTSVGFWIGAAEFASAPFRVDMQGNAVATSLTLTGSILKYGKTSFADTVNAGYYISSDGIYFGAAADANYLKYSIAAATFVIHGCNIDGATINNLTAGSELAIQGWQFTGIFSATDYRIVAWTLGDIKLTDGTTFNITAGNTGNMAALTYIYFDKAVSTTTLQVTTTAANAVGSNKILMCVAEPNTDTTSKASYQAFGGSGGQNIFVNNIAANSASVNEFVSNTAQIKDLIVTNAKISSLAVDKLTAGTITSKIISLAVSDGSGDSFFNSGKTDFTNTDAGFILGVDDSDSNYAKFYIGDSSKYLNWTGTDLIISADNVVLNGSTLSFSDVFGDGSDGNVTISANTTLTSDMHYNNLTVSAGFTLNAGGYRIFVKGTTINNGTISRKGNNGGNGTNGGTGVGGHGHGGTAGAALADANLAGSIIGAVGGDGGDGGPSALQGYPGVTGVNGSNQTYAYCPAGSAGVTGGRGGNGGASYDFPGTVQGREGGAGSSGGTVAGTIKTPPHNLLAAFQMADIDDTADYWHQIKTGASSGSSGGGGGGGGGSAVNGGAGGGGGGTGSPGGVMVIFSKHIINNGVITCDGGDGGNGGNGGNGESTGNDYGGGGGAGGGAGAGAPGGILVMVYNSYTGAGTKTANGGAAGTPGTHGNGGAGSSHNGDAGDDGTAGNAGLNGKLIELPV